MSEEAVVSYLTVKSTVITICTTCFNIQYLCILSTEYIYAFRMIIRIDSDYFRNSINQLIFEIDTCCFLCGTD
jgi:hypothetical protein